MALRTFLLATMMVLSLAAHAQAPRPPAPTPTAVPMVSLTKRLLLSLEADGKHVADVMVDAWMQRQGERTLAWSLTVNYTLPVPPLGPAKGKGKARTVKPQASTFSRQYGSSVQNKVGGRNLRMDLSPNAVSFDLPTLGGDQLIPVNGGKDAQGHWALMGDVIIGKGKQAEHWTAKSVHQIVQGKSTLVEVP